MHTGFVQAKGGITSLIELSPADESSGVIREGFLEVVATDNTKIIIWTNSNGEPEPILRMRAILMERKNLRKLSQGQLDLVARTGESKCTVFWHS